MSDPLRSELVERLRRAAPGPDDRVISLLLTEAGRRNAERWNDADAYNVIAFLLTSVPRSAPAGWKLVPVDVSDHPEIIEAMRHAWRETRSPGVSGMTIDAQWRAEHARELAAYRAMLSTAPSPSPVARVPDRERARTELQAAWDDVSTLPPIDFTCDEAEPIVARITALFTASPSDGSGEGK
jgi:hypothetical protein